jgi:hypothetical protein
VEPSSSTRREFLTLGAALAAVGVSTPAVAAGAKSDPTPLTFDPSLRIPATPGGPMPWIRRFLHLYTGDDGRAIAEVYPLRQPANEDFDQLLRRTAYRVTLGATRAGAGWDFHVANHPTLLIPLFGSLVIGLADGTQHEFGHGDVAFAEDCTGQGHRSFAGAQGAFVVQVQLPKSVCPPWGSSDMTRIWRD